ncbi:branched-chain amino acid ABC transporter permease [Haloterrigena salifodinae]|uniref:Branched-chain amino acid ABC transporter permease n=1 Tax=Haloterrigena salifodinae TaxID=2675099 RepID=A0A8T8E138_9EURY|nr:branched-chain amino acid ABC transporter permease [Haloterrigena salifodinae]QRV15302.1 branched-chain amino acid ABC transporter permease [Haloterrigena salifodinae]
MSTVDEAVNRGRNLSSEQLLLLVVGIGAVALLGDLILGLASGTYSISRVARYVTEGILYGLIIGLAGIGLSMTYSILNFANFAHGDYVTTGAFFGWGVTYLVAGWGVASVGPLVLVAPQREVSGAQLDVAITATPIAVLAGLLVAGVATALFVLLIDRLAFKPVRGSGGIPLLITSVGVAFALRYVLVFVYSSSTRGTTASVPSVDFLLVDGYVSIGAHDATLIVAAVALMLGVHFLLQRTKLGKAMRAMSDNRDLALVTGIPTERVIRWTWMIGGGLAGTAGYLMVLWTGTIDWQFGWLLLLLIFAAVILGGIGSIYGAIFGGLVIGVGMHMSMIWLPGGDFTTITAFLLMILVLLIRPSGLFGGKTTA